MKKLFFIFIAFTLFTTNSYCQVGIGTTTPSSVAMLEVSSQTNATGAYRGFMPPRVPNFAARQSINATSIDVGLLVFVESLGCLQIWNGSAWESIYCLNTIPTEPWINEFHYDNVGADESEFIEIAGPSGLDLSKYRILLYNGTDGKTYDSFLLSGIIDFESNSFGALSFTRSNIQNGIEGTSTSADGIALIKISNSQVIQFISYEGIFMATNNTANGMTSIDIGVEESDTTTPIGNSLQLTGTGNSYGDFMWNPPAVSSQGSLNAGQIIN
ncbi:hypothetical protein Aeqsu_2730 [Aequorivita sublithincola DSM 14238]|uniref:LTD domain-containing protein n=1 Tax=Aequorivita sublithincola (strain DSM 14238 / LMG 21431 / ACAM 643 / 9-3) TaxID=746697 RepID=I3YYW3_AEQSU|nr:hypothetical protein [Aequorivita sublithincola]AFL82181.1 hypothetical protein Aeqsu_2730 [Aequorivita sublithincola DSM 14238]